MKKIGLITITLFVVLFTIPVVASAETYKERGGFTVQSNGGDLVICKADAGAKEFMFFDYDGGNHYQMDKLIKNVVLNKGECSVIDAEAYVDGSDNEAEIYIWHQYNLIDPVTFHIYD